MSSSASYGKSGLGNGTGGGGKSSGSGTGGGAKSAGSSKVQCDQTPQGRLGYYHWNFSDSAHILVNPATGDAGTATVIEANDGYGGRNIKCGSFHVHTAGASMKIKVVRFKGAAAQLDQNIIKLKDHWDACASNLAKLEAACTAAAFPMHAALLQRLKDAIAGSDAELT